ncbi:MULTISPECIES: hypothetical protein [Haloferacaceae]|uniref:Restriction endonuclease n=1 Tax=Halorubrum glutamatedens TaxID=2707018 RepID=A0ABD5QU94_9EURY|nr:hypothetical protein [Halobellus captivus]
MSLSTTIDLRRPEHTGENRCWPCTAVNVALISVAAAAVSVASVPAAAGVGVAGLVLVWLRGYVVPGTPRFAPRLVAPIPGSDALFHGTGGDRVPDAGSGSLNPDDVDGEELLGRLLDEGVLEADGDTVAPTPEFDERWQAEMTRLRTRETESLAEIARDVSPATESRTIRNDGDEWIALSSGDANTVDETWLRRPVAIAEIAGYRAAEPFLSDDSIRLAAARTNRMFLNACPDCGTELERGTDMSCCGGHTGPGEEPAETLVCPTCEVRLYTYPQA